MANKLSSAAFPSISASAKQDVNIAQSLQWVARHYRISPVTQMKDILSLSLSGCKLEPDRYFYYQLYRPEISAAEKKRFIGKQMQYAIFIACNSLYWWQAAQDKLTFYGIMQGNQFPVPDVHAVIDPLRRFGKAASLRNSESLDAWLANEAVFPCFIKPVDSALGEAANALKSFQPDGALEIMDGKTLTLAQLWDICSRTKGGMMAQERLQPHEALLSFTGDRIASVRLVVLLKESGPTLFDAAWRVPTGSNMVDNFFRIGNVMAGLDKETGRVTRAMQGKAVELKEIDQHPDSACTFKDFTLPDWQQAVSMTLEASRLFPGIRLQSWDVALTTRGPVFLEMNPGGNIDQSQFLDGKGLWHGELKDFVLACYKDDVNKNTGYPKKEVDKLLR